VTGQLLGTSGSVLLGGFATLAVAAIWWVLFPALREVDGFPDLREADGFPDPPEAGPPPPDPEPDRSG
jgi:hypothetical protein